LHKAGKFDASSRDRYIESFYWSLATFLLVGSKGDTPAETIYCIIILMITVGLFAYILSILGGIVGDLSARSFKE